jgi:hypothetical protein
VVRLPDRAVAVQQEQRDRSLLEYLAQQPGRLRRGSQVGPSVGELTLKIRKTPVLVHGPSSLGGPAGHDVWIAVAG